MQEMINYLNYYVRKHKDQLFYFVTFIKKSIKDVLYICRFIRRTRKSIYQKGYYKISYCSDV